MRTVPVIIVVTALLTLVVAPATCSAGVLAHCCAPEDTDHGAEHHEDACPADPCNRDSLLLTAKSADDDETQDTSRAPAILPVRLVRPGGADPAVRRDVELLHRSATGGARSLPLLC